jgi:hypothetical protein
MKTKLYFLTGLILVFGLLGKGFCQVIPVDEDTKKIVYKEVVTQEGKPAEMYNHAIEWINSFYPNPNDVTRIRDAENARIEIKHRIKVWNLDKDGNKLNEAGLVEYEMSLEFKEGRYRYTITNFNVKKTSKFPLERWMDKTDPEYVPACDSYVKQVDDEVRNIIKSLKTGMKPKANKNDNW